MSSGFWVTFWPLLLGALVGLTVGIPLGFAVRSLLDPIIEKIQARRRSK